MSQLSPTERSWARGLTVFAATIMIIAGVFQGELSASKHVDGAKSLIAKLT